jgi:predicted aspartyl protease
MSRRPSSLWFAGVASALVLAAPLRGQEQPTAPAAPPADETIDYRVVETRMSVPVSIGAHGPFNFIVDTGSERTVVSEELARELALGPGRIATVHSMTEVSQIPTVIVSNLRVGQRTMEEDIHAPALSRSNLGALGILGVDTLQNQRVVFDFKRREMTVTPSQRSAGRWPEGTIVVTARSRFGRLMLVDAAVDGQRVWVIIDTGAQLTVGNSALRRALASRQRLGPTGEVRMISVTGGLFTAESMMARRIRIGGADIVNLPIAFADVHPFAALDLLDRPAILLGMDALGLFERVSVDFANRRVRLLTPESSLNGATVRIAGGGSTRLGS